VFLHTLTSKSKSVEEQRPSAFFIQPESMLPGTQNDNIVIESLEFPDYSDQATRLQSFKYWAGVLPKEELAEAGFYMIARRDVVRCFSCRVVLQDWEKTDNVIDEHQRHSPNCPFLKTHLSNISSLSRPSVSIIKTNSTENSIEMWSRNYHSSQFDTTLTSLSSLHIRESHSVEKSSHEPSPSGFIVNEGLPTKNGVQEIPGIRYPPSWTSNPPPPMSPPLGGSDSEESTSSQKKLNYSTLTSLQQSTATTSNSKQIVVSTVLPMCYIAFVQLCMPKNWLKVGVAPMNGGVKTYD